MKILHTVEQYLPLRNGMSEVVRQLSERMVMLGHSVTVATSLDVTRTTKEINGVQIRQFDIAGNAVSGISGGDVNKYVHFVKNGGFDIITCFAAQHWATDLLLPHLLEIEAGKCFVPTGFSALNLPSFANYFREMPIWMSRFDMNIFLSDGYQDAVFARQHDITNRILIPNGASEDEFLDISSGNFRQKLGISENTHLILHVGSYTGLKGHWEAARIFLEAGLPNCFLLFAGQNVDEIRKGLGRRLRYLQAPLAWLARGNRILIKNLDRKDIVAAFKAADILLFPSKVECSPVVLFEASAAGTPFLSSAVGNAPEIAAWTGGGSIIPTKIIRSQGIPDINAGSRMLREMINDRSLRRQMSERGRQAWKERYTWERITTEYLSVYKSIYQNRNPKI